MSQMSNINDSNNVVNEVEVYNEGLSPGRCLWLGCADPVVIKEPSKLSGQQDNICVMTCYCQSQPGVGGYRQRLDAFWKEKGFFQKGEQRLCDKMRMIQKKGWLS